MKNLYLVQVSDAFGKNKFLPLAIGYQWVYAKNNNWSLKDVLIEKLPVDAYVATMDNPDMIAMSCYIWNWQYNQLLAKSVKKLWPHCIIVVGGPQVSKNDSLFFEKYPMFDIAVHGEGEQAFKEILLRKENFDEIPHVQTRTHFPDPARRRMNISDIPSPILEGFYDPILAKYPKDTVWQVSLETLRGCPYHCTFCDIGDIYWNKLTLFDIDRVKKEIDWIGNNKITYVSVCDSNWGLLDRDIELTQYVIDTKLRIGYPEWWDATWAKNNLERNFQIAMLNKNSGVNIFKGVTFAMQSFNDSTLEASKRFNLEETKVNEYLKKYNDEGISTYSELIWPMPEETYTSLKFGVQKLIDLGQDDFLMIHPLVITDNAKMGDRFYQATYKIKTKKVPLDTYYLSWAEYKNSVIETTDAVYSTRTANWNDVLKGHLFSWISITLYYYGWGHYLVKYLKSFGYKETEVFETLLSWIENNKDTLLYKELEITKTHIEDTFHKMKPWGRYVSDVTDILWEYKGASSIVFHENRYTLKDELIRFLSDSYDINNIREAVELNLLLCKDFSTIYPITVTTVKDVAKRMIGVDSEEIIVDHTDRNETDKELFFLKAYHWKRKLGYWRCSFTIVPDDDKK